MQFMGPNTLVRFPLEAKAISQSRFCGAHFICQARLHVVRTRKIIPRFGLESRSPWEDLEATSQTDTSNQLELIREFKTICHSHYKQWEALSRF